MNLNKLKGKLREQSQTYSSAGKALGISTQTFSNKINGHIEFNVEEANRLAELLEMSPTEKLTIFFE